MENYKDFINFVNEKNEKIRRNKLTLFEKTITKLGIKCKIYIDIIDMLSDLEKIVDNDLILDIYVSLYKYNDTIDFDNEDKNKFIRVRVNIKNTDNFINKNNDVLNLNSYEIIDSDFILRDEEQVLDYTKSEKSNIRKVNDILAILYEGMRSNNIRIPDFEDRYFIVKYEKI